ncbi:MAG TPA: kynureninase [Acidimicrobiales bacterium]|nr:kynureninase [Acidimicrobiales bacterium]
MMQSQRERDAFDRVDPLRTMRHRFARPHGRAGADDSHGEVAYLCGHSLGLMPSAARDDVEAVLDAWASLGVEGHFDGADPWYRYDEALAPAMAALVGAEQGEVALMGTLTANLHHLFASFFEPSGRRTKILIEATTFPSDRYAVIAQLRWHGLDPREHLVEVEPDPAGLYGIDCWRDVLAERGEEIALVWLGGVNYLTGESLDVPGIVAAGHRAGCLVGFDLAHAAGNVALQLHAWDVDFAVWCTYKYLNAGPGAVAALFVHQRHGTDPRRVRLAGWWGNDPATRFDMPLDFVPVSGAAGWRMSNPPILSLAPLRASLALFAEAGAEPLHTKSRALSTYAIAQLSALGSVEVLTPTDPQRRGSQVSIKVPGRAVMLERALRERGVLVDVRPPDVVRFAAVPLYCSMRDVGRLIEAVQSVCD